jgi:hypothetical protein
LKASKDRIPFRHLDLAAEDLNAQEFLIVTEKIRVHRLLYRQTGRETLSSICADRLKISGEIMDTLLMVAVVLITLAVIAQAGVLLAMYLMSRRITGKVEVLMDESQKLIAPLESVTRNLKSISEDLTETGQIARRQVLNIQATIGETRDRFMATVEEARETVMRPIRQYAAIASAIAEGVRTFVQGKQEEVEEAEIEIEIDHEEHPAA